MLALSDARQIVETRVGEPDALFEALKAIAGCAHDPTRSGLARELLIRLLDKRNEIPRQFHSFLQALVRQQGLFPYLEDVEELGLADRLAYEAHRPASIPGRDVVLHSEQAAIYHRLLEGENVVLSAPTSFGKTLIIDALLAAKSRWRNVAVIVPTIALMDEMRRRFAVFGGRYKVITHGSQPPAMRNIYVMTQERMLDLGKMPRLDFFAIDEFYKLDPEHGADRANQLNILLHQLLGTGAQYFLLGPNIDGLTSETSSQMRATFISSGFTTVVTDVERVNIDSKQVPDRLAAECRRLGGQTLIFCSGPQRARTVAQWLMDREVGDGRGLENAAAWVADTYHPDWLIGKALAQGIGIHHGKLPRALAHHMVRLFNERRLPYLVVTSTLIEGVNTVAKNVIILDNKIARDKFDYFTFANIRGRSGRMLQHFIGRVIVFNEPPEKAGLVVDLPAVSQTAKASDEVLIQLPWDQLTDTNKDRMRPYYEQDLISVSTLRKSKGIAPDRQLEVARQLSTNPHLRSGLSWYRFPTTSQVKAIGEVLYELVKPRSTSRTVVSAKQMTARLNILRHHRGDLKKVIEAEVERGAKPDEAVETALDFTRTWAQFHIPRGLVALERIATDVLGGASVANTRGFANEVERLFQPQFATVLEEYGLPLSLTTKLDRYLRLSWSKSLDEVLDRVRAIPRRPAELGAFELEMLHDTQAGL